MVERMASSVRHPPHRLFEQAARFGLALLTGQQASRLTRDRFQLLGMDVDDEAGIGVVHLARGADWLRCDYERDATGAWFHLGGGIGSANPDMVGPRPRAADEGTPLLCATGGISFSRSRRDRMSGDTATLRDVSAAGFVASFWLRAADAVENVVVAERRIAVPEHGRLTVVWKAAPSQFRPVARPPVLALDAHGNTLTRLDPFAPLDDVTMRAVTGTGAGTAS
jgi:hypothetical protein